MLRFERRVCRWSPAGCTNSWACGSTRIAEGPDSESGSLGGASPFMPTISRQLASAGIADPGDLKSPRLPGASPGLPTGVWFTGNSRPVRFKTEQPWECKSPHADHFGMSTGQVCRASVLTSACLRASGALQFAIANHSVWGTHLAGLGKPTPRHSATACSSKRTGGFIPRIALDQCRVRERYPARRPFCPHSSKHRAGAS
jgi:hypothetical protein